MLKIVMHLDEEDTSIINYERLYVTTIGSNKLCKVRARSVEHAERKLMACFLKELPGKTVDFNLEKYLGIEELPPSPKKEKANVKTDKEEQAVQGELGL